jgi:hypothetical protein
MAEVTRAAAAAAAPLPARALVRSALLHRVTRSRGRVRGRRRRSENASKR